jgi:hypothetical protein
MRSAQHSLRVSFRGENGPSLLSQKDPLSGQRFLSKVKKRQV